MKHTEYNWKSNDGLNLFAQSWSPEKEIKNVILLVHGHGEHSTRYYHWAERFVNNNYAVLAFDLRGHGKSEGKRGHTPGYESFMKDIDLLIDKSEELFPGKEKILYGHSLGGNLVLNYGLRRESGLKAIIATSPWIRLVISPTNLQLALAKVMKNILPGLVQHSKLPAELISRDKTEVQKYVNDPLVHDKISVIEFLSVVESGEWALHHAEEFKKPLLLMHGSGDQVTSHKASEYFYQKARKVATIKIWEGCYHELHHESDREQAFQFIIDWLNNLN